MAISSRSWLRNNASSSSKSTSSRSSRSSWWSSANISQSSYNRIVSEAAAKWISAATVAKTAGAAWISVWWSKSYWSVSSSWIKAATEAAWQWVTYNEATWKYTKPTSAIQEPVEPIQTVNNQWVSWESPWPSSWDATGAVASWWWQEAAAESQWQHQQGVVSWSWSVWSGSWWQTKQQVLDQAVRSWQATVDAQQNVISRSWKNLGNLAWINLEDNAIWPITPDSSIPVQEQTSNAANQEQIEQQKINAIKPDVDLWLSHSPDSPYWNSFGNWAIEMEKTLPWYMNERNKVIASSMMLNNPSIRFMSEWARKDAILKNIIDRQEGWIDPEMEWRYKNTIDNVNNLINREMPSYSSNDFFGMLVNWENIDYIAAWWNPALKAARTRFNDMNKYSTMDASWLSIAIENWEVLKWSQLWNDLINKWMWEVLNKAYWMYNTKTQSSVYNYVSNEVNWFNPDLSLENQASKKIELGTWLEMQISEKILSLMTNDKLPTLASFIAADEDIQRAKETSRKTEAEINDLSDQITEFSDDVKLKVVEKWWEATWDPFLDAYIQEKTKPFVKRLTQLQWKYRNEIAILSDLTENARTEFEIKEYNKNAEIQGYQFLLWRLDKQKAEETAAQKAAQDQANREKSFWLQREQFERQKSKADMPNMQITWYDSNWKPIYQYYDSKSNTWKNAPSESSIQATGTYVNTRFWNKNIDVDTAILPALQSAQSELDANGIKIAVWQRKRDQTETIKGMAAKYWIEFNEQNPNETAAALRKAWHQVADVGKSKHESWMAIDIYASGWWKVDDRTKSILNKYWFYQTAGAWDLWHFEYVGSLAWEWSDSMTNIAQWIYNGTMSSNDILNQKTLKEYWLEWQSRDSIINTVNKSLFDTYLNKESTKDEINQIVERSKATFPKDPDTWISPLADTVWSNKAYQYLMENDLMEYDTENPEAVNYMGSLLEKVFEWKKVDRDILYASLKNRFGRSVANDLLDYLEL